MDGETDATTDQMREIVRLQAENAGLRADVERKELLLRALAHQAGSTSAGMASLLAAQLRQTRDPVARATLELTHEKLAALARVQRLLAGQATLGPVDLLALLRTLATALGDALDARARHIQVRVGGLGVVVPAALASTAALIASELAANALRYAFRGRPGGTVELLLRREGSVLHLCVQDDGVGLSDKTLKQDGTGLWLVRSLAFEAGATLTIRREAGTAFHIAFPLPARRESGGS